MVTTLTISSSDLQFASIMLKVSASRSRPTSFIFLRTRDTPWASFCKSVSEAFIPKKYEQFFKIVNITKRDQKEYTRGF